MDRWREVELLVRTAELGSLSKAAESLGMSNATATRCLVCLENRLATRLVDRNTRRLALTETGEIFYRHCKTVLAGMKEAEAAVTVAALAPAGTLRITGSLSFCIKHIAPLMPEFTQRYPNIDLHIVGANRYYDPIDSDIDVAIRTREYEADSSITVRKLAETRRILAASPAYLAKHGTPRTLEELGGHKLLLYSHANTPNELRFARGGRVQTVRVKSLLESNDGQILCAAALEGLGILVQPNTSFTTTSYGVAWFRC
jgi:DNA-binding transcriptional LysR family regulator